MLFSRCYLILLASITFVMTVGCSDDDNGTTPAPVDYPTVSQTSPANGDTDVMLNTSISIWFSDEMDETSLGGVAGTGVMIHDTEFSAADTAGGSKFTLHLAVPLEGETTYQITVPTTVKDTDGNGLEDAYVFSFTTGIRDCAHLEDQFEPNDFGNEAAEIELDKTYMLLSVCGGDDDARADYYEFTLTEAAKVTFRVRGVGDYLPRRWFSNLQTTGNVQYFAVSDSLRNDRDITDYYSFLPGTYRLCVRGYPEDTDPSVYNLTLETSAPSLDDDYEDNDFSFDAVRVEAGLIEGLIGCHKDLDYFDIVVGAGQTLVITMTEVTLSDEWRGLYLFDESSQVDRDTGYGDVLTVFVTTEDEATYRMNAQWHGDCVEYTLNFDLSDIGF